MSKAWSPKTWKSNEINLDGVFAEHEDTSASNPQVGANLVERECQPPSPKGEGLEFIHFFKLLQPASRPHSYA
jgi:hypothetical protein